MADNFDQFLADDSLEETKDAPAPSSQFDSFLEDEEIAKGPEDNFDDFLQKDFTGKSPKQEQVKDPNVFQGAVSISAAPSKFPKLTKEEQKKFDAVSRDIEIERAKRFAKPALNRFFDRMTQSFGDEITLGLVGNDPRQQVGDLADKAGDTIGTLLGFSATTRLLGPLAGASKLKKVGPLARTISKGLDKLKKPAVQNAARLAIVPTAIETTREVVKGDRPLLAEVISGQEFDLNKAERVALKGVETAVASVLTDVGLDKAQKIFRGFLKKTPEGKNVFQSPKQADVLLNASEEVNLTEIEQVNLLQKELKKKPSRVDLRNQVKRLKAHKRNLNNLDHKKTQELIALEEEKMLALQQGVDDPKQALKDFDSRKKKIQFERNNISEDALAIDDELAINRAKLRGMSISERKSASEIRAVEKEIGESLKIKPTKELQEFSDLGIDRTYLRASFGEDIVDASAFDSSAHKNYLPKHSRFLDDKYAERFNKLAQDNGGLAKTYPNRFSVFKAADNIEDIGDVSLIPRRAARAQDAVEEAAGGGYVTNMVHRPAQEALASVIDYRKEISSVASKIQKKYGIKLRDNKSSRGIYEILNTVSAEELDSLSPQALRGKYKNLSEVGDNVFEASQEVRTLFDLMRSKTNIARVRMGKEAIKFRDKYVPSIEKINFINQFKKAGKDLNISSLEDFIQPTDVKNARALERFDKIPSSKREKNIWKLLDTYSNASANDIYLSPAIENIKAHSNYWRETGKVKAAKYWENVAKALKGEEIGGLFGNKVGGKLRLAMKKANQARIQAGLTANINWASAIQPSSFFLNLNRAGVKNTLQGSLDYIVDPNVRKLVRQTTSARIKASGAGVSTRGESGRFGQNIYKSKLESVGDFLNVFSNSLEFHLQGASTAAGLRRGRQLGLKGKELLQFANDVAEDTQSMYNRGSRALILENTPFKFVAPFQSFYLEMFGAAREILKGQGFKQTKRERIGKAVSLITSMYLANQYSNAVGGRDSFGAGSFVPVFGPALESAGKEALSATEFGQQLGVEPPQFQSREPLAPLEDFKNAKEAFVDYLKTGNTTALRRFGVFWGAGALGLPGSQLNRLVDNIALVENGVVVSGRTGKPVKSKSGIKLRQSETDKILGFVTGPFATPGARKFFKKRDEQRKKK